MRIAELFGYTSLVIAFFARVTTSAVRTSSQASVGKNSGGVVRLIRKKPRLRDRAIQRASVLQVPYDPLAARDFALVESRRNFDKTPSGYSRTVYRFFFFFFFFLRGPMQIYVFSAEGFFFIELRAGTRRS